MTVLPDTQATPRSSPKSEIKDNLRVLGTSHKWWRTSQRSKSSTDGKTRAKFRRQLGEFWLFASYALLINRPGAEPMLVLPRPEVCRTPLENWLCSGPGHKGPASFPLTVLFIFRNLCSILSPSFLLLLGPTSTRNWTSAQEEKLPPWHLKRKGERLELPSQ